MDEQTCANTQMIQLASRLQHEGMFLSGMREVLQSQRMQDLLICILKRALLSIHLREVFTEAIENAAKLAWSPGSVGVSLDGEENDALITVTPQQAPQRQMDQVVISGIKEMLPMGQMDGCAIAALTESLGSGQLDGIAQALFRQLQIDGEQAAAMCAAVHRRELDQLLLGTLTDLMVAGDLDTLMVDAVMEVLALGQLNETLIRAILNLEAESIGDNMPHPSGNNADDTREHRDSCSECNPMHAVESQRDREAHNEQCSQEVGGRPGQPPAWNSEQWRLWLQDSAAKLHHLEAVLSWYRHLCDSDRVVDLRVMLVILQWFWVKRHQTQEDDVKEALPELLQSLIQCGLPPECRTELESLITRPDESSSLNRTTKACTFRQSVAALPTHDNIICNTLRRTESGVLLTLRERVIQTHLCDVLLEAVFPTCAIIVPPDKYVHQNTSVMSMLASGEAYSGPVAALALTMGSSAEGLAMVPGWGHPGSDVDEMVLLAAQFAVHLPQSADSSARRPESSVDRGISCLEYDSQGCPPAYTRLRVTDLQDCRTGFAELNLDVSFLDQSAAHGCWIHTALLNEEIQRVYNEAQPDKEDCTTVISGPAGQARGGLFEFVPALVASDPHPAMDDFVRRSRGAGWPSQQQLDEIRQQPMLLVLVGHRESPDVHQQARVSWSPIEWKLISELPNTVKQGFIAFKQTFKCFMHGQIKLDGRSHVGSYQLKTTLLYYLEKNSPSKISSPFGLLISLFYELKKYLQHGVLPHYFLPECNLLETVGPDELEVARQAIRNIMSDPVSALLKCPSSPRDIYGDISPDELLTVFRRVYTCPACKQSREDLRHLLSQLDGCRQPRYQRQVDLDSYKRYRVRGRPNCIRLVDMFAAIKNNCEDELNTVAWCKSWL